MADPHTWAAQAPPRLFAADDSPFEHAQVATAAAHDGAAAATRPCSNALLWHAGGECEAVNGLSGRKLGANKKSPSPKHRAAVCKALLLRRFRELCRAVPADRVPAELLAPEAAELSYAVIKLRAASYQQRKTDFLHLEAFRDWVVAPGACEAFAAEA